MTGQAILLEGGRLSIFDPEDEFPKLVLWVVPNKIIVREGESGPKNVAYEPTAQAAVTKVEMMVDAGIAGYRFHRGQRFRINLADHWNQYLYEDEPLAEYAIFKVLQPNPRTFARKQAALQGDQNRRLERLERDTYGDKVPA